MSIDSTTFRDAMACVGAAVNIITTDGPAGRAGFTASAVCSVTDSPPTLLVCLNRSASVWPVFSNNQALCVNTLAAGQEGLSNLFGGKTPMEERFAAAGWQQGETGCPRLTGALASFDCHISQVVSVGTHDILFCQIVDIARHPTPEGLVWFDRRYHALPANLPTV
ncbi:pyrimidine utilization flavin reductase protein F [Kosakonia radicincitans DSM 16656]|uniref:FMN reductase (NADH) RutF n=1 Tax=Kosakonia radicincitans TaxID=283686 RepID=A0AAX2EZS2_9ENTR|nr:MULTISPECIES: pyrimidine utilization flavin reductase protein F [Kosakonia]MDP9564382.1 flavin reductase [Kosakonia oryzae]APG17570.1 FMN reductase [Kosakonia radicincitans]ARD61488.1 pyrimidine utilization flavin reductase protein F [Kosakonia radicincitans DSM 16656]KDE37289.1 4-hydroxyphenylacetate 3-monooxygenase [Kosakonia radicincitans UMEnt01/12]MDD7997729.1 pyrimidine utilization flavin reductase protein F [Kosakonia radicincitans]